MKEYLWFSALNIGAPLNKRQSFLVWFLCESVTKNIPQTALGIN